MENMNPLNNILNRTTFFAAVLLGAVLGSNVSIAQQTQESAQTESSQRIAWWQDAKFGMFIHWGAYAKSGGEWKGDTDHAEWLQFTAKIPLAEYTEYAKTFDPNKFDADEWAQIASDAGMKYMVVTAKHHDGIAMYKSASSSHNIVDLAGLKIDPIGELAEACRKKNIQFCVYYSLGRDWEDPNCPTGTSKTKPGWRSNLLDFPNEKEKDLAKYFERKVKPQVRELLTSYGPIGVMWFDTPERITPEQSAELMKLIHSIQPDCIVNQRVGNGLGDYGTPEQKIPTEIGAKPWETCMTLNGHWGYNKADQKWKSHESLIRNLIDIVSKGGNYLLNVGPTGEGVINEPSVTRLSAMGDWLAKNGEAIYECGPTPFGKELGSVDETKKDKKGRPHTVVSWDYRVTTKTGKLYLHIFKWPKNGVFELNEVTQKVTGVSFLVGGQKCAFEQSANKLTINLPKQATDKVATVVCVEIDDQKAETTNASK